MNSKVLINFAHPAIHKSYANATMLKQLVQEPGLTVNDLYHEYPDLHIDCKREQGLLLDHGLIVFMHPFYWYSSPAIIKEWQDIVLEYNFAYGKDGKKLVNKKWQSVITTAGPEKSYCESGTNKFTIRELLRPFEQTANLCGMKFLEPIVLFEARDIARSDLENQAKDMAKSWRSLVKGSLDA